MTDLPAPHYIAQACRTCGASVLPVSAVDSQGRHVTVLLDASVPVFCRQTDGDDGHVWIQESSRQIKSRHYCRIMHSATPETPAAAPTKAVARPAIVDNETW